MKPKQTKKFKWEVIPPRKINQFSDTVRLGKSGRLSVPGGIAGKLGEAVETMLDREKAVLGLRPVAKEHVGSRRVLAGNSKSGRASINIKNVLAVIAGGEKLAGQTFTHQWHDDICVIHLAIQ